jgi:putative aldouronate transport system substrate-binding protein
VIDQMTAPDGHVYGIGGYAEALKYMYHMAMWINKVWLDKLGLDMPTTPDEFFDVLMAFKTEDPNDNGKADEIPMTSCIDNHGSGRLECFLMNAWIYEPPDTMEMLNLKNGEVYPPYTQDEWREGLTFMNKLHEYKLLDTEAFVQDRTMMKQQIMGEHVLVGAFPAGKPTNMAPDNSEQTKQYTVVPPLKGPNGHQTAAYEAPGVVPGYAGNILANCEIPEIAFRWIDFCYSEEARLFQVYGEEDFNWRRALPGELGMDGKQAIFKEIHKFGDEELAGQIWGYAAPNFVPSALYVGTVTEQDDPFDSEPRLYRNAILYQNYGPKEFLPRFSWISTCWRNILS